MSLKYVLLCGHLGDKFLREYSEAIGIELTRKLYGEYWPRLLVLNECLWVAYEADKQCGWVALRPDPVDPIVWEMLGIFPDFQHKGYMKEIFKWAVLKSFSLWPNRAMCYAISKHNPDFIEYNYRKTLKHPETRCVMGETYWPKPGYVIFAILSDREFKK